MVAYSRDAELDGGADRAFALALNGFVHLYFRRDVLDDMVRWLRADGYHLVNINCGEWTSAADMHGAVSQAFAFSGYYGRNLAALNDCLSDVACFDYGTSEAATGTILVLTRFDAFVAADRCVAQSLLDIFADNARRAALIGHRMLCLVQSDDPRLELEPVGATAVDWNPKEWLTATRISDHH